MILRDYVPGDCAALAELFYRTVHTVNAADYTKEQLDAWADGCVPLAEWDSSFRAHVCVVAVEGDTIVGFGDMDKNGYLDRLYVHAAHQRKGIATAICDRLEAAAPKRVMTHASITAKPFFKKRGYRVIREQQVERRGVLLTNYVMEKEK